MGGKVYSVVVWLLAPKPVFVEECVGYGRMYTHACMCVWRGLGLVTTSVTTISISLLYMVPGRRSYWPWDKAVHVVLVNWS